MAACIDARASRATCVHVCIYIDLCVYMYICVCIYIVVYGGLYRREGVKVYMRTYI